MAEQLRMPWDPGPTRSAGRPDRPRRDRPAGDDLAGNHPAARAGRARRRPPANRPVRGEPDLADTGLPETGTRRFDWRIDERTRLTGLRGIARARAALRAGDPDGPDPGHRDAA